jgi:ribosomal protein S18 acetylase RimI-like enzyme
MSTKKSDPGPGLLETDAITVRLLEERDLEAIVRIDASAGRTRREYYRDRVSAAVKQSRIRTSLVAEVDGSVVGFLMASIGVHVEFRGKKVGAAMMRQFMMNVKALNVRQVRTDVAWNDTELIHFFDKNGFVPGGRIVLERNIE